MNEGKTHYITIESESKGMYKEKGSKFLSFLYPVSTIEEIKSILEKFKKDYFDARHICYAYSIGPNRENFRYNDDGEPSGTAGKPIYGQILSAEITNCLIVVVRYFGGVLLGTGGLITAYKAAALDAISNSSIVNRDVLKLLEVSVDFVKLNDLMKLIKEFNVRILQQKFEMICTYEIEISLSVYPVFLAKLKNIDNLNFSEKENEI